MREEVQELTATLNEVRSNLQLDKKKFQSRLEQTKSELAQQEKVVSEILEKYERKHGANDRGNLEDIGRLKKELTDFTQQNIRLQELNSQKDEWLEDILDRVDSLKEQMLRDGEQFTKTALQLEVRRYQVEIMRGLMKDGDLDVPVAIDSILRDLGSMDHIEPYDDIASEDHHH